MTAFWLTTINAIDWQFNAVDGIWAAIWCFWLWLIWPEEDIKRLINDRDVQQRLLMVLIGITGLWLMNASVMQGLHVHFLGLVTVVLMFGWRLTSVAIMLPVAFFSLFVLKHPAEFFAYAVCGVLTVIVASMLFYSVVYHYLPKQVFVFIFCAGFINAGLSMVGHLVIWSGYLWVSTDYDWSFLLENYLLMAPLLGFPEALLNGMAVTLLVVYRPQWLYDYSDKHYF